MDDGRTAPRIRAAYLQNRHKKGDCTRRQTEYSPTGQRKETL